MDSDRDDVRADPPRLGELEAEVMGIVWEMGEATVRDVQRALRPQRSPAYTTVMTVMSRLADKRLLERRKEGRAYVYSPATARDKVAGGLLERLVGSLYDGASGRAIAHLLEADEEIDEAELERLERLIREKRESSR